MDATSAVVVSSPKMVDCAASAAVESTFAPSVWGDFFITYKPPATQRSEEWIRERTKELKRRVRGMFQDGEVMGVAKAVEMVDTVERLGLGIHFREEIAATISCSIHGAGVEDIDNLHIAATRFRLLRQHGIWVSADALDKFRDGAGSFSSDPRGLLSLYNAAHMAIRGEATLDDAIALARHHLQAMKGYLQSPLAEQVSRALENPLPRYTKDLETMHYVGEYAVEETHDGTLLELAKLNRNIMRAFHLRELKALSMWWRDLYDTANLKYARDRLVEVYFMSCGMIPEEEESRARVIFVKAYALVSLLDDTFDVHATIQECTTLNEAFQRWDKSAVSILPEYLRMLYVETLRDFEEFENLLEPHERSDFFFAKREYQRQSQYYMLEAQWTNDKYQPSFEEHAELSTLSSTLPMLMVAGLVGYRGAVKTKEMLEWASAYPDAIRAASKIGRLLNDVSAYNLGRNKKDVVSAVECYMMEKGVSGDDAVAAIAAITEDCWRVLNKACMEVKPALLPAAQLAASVARTLEPSYIRGKCCYTYPVLFKDLLTKFYLAPIPL